jgi:hypothetical protein
MNASANGQARCLPLFLYESESGFTEGHSQYTWLGFDVAFAGIEIGGGNVAAANEKDLE